MKQAVQVVSLLNLVAFVALAALAIRHWRLRHDRAAAWAAISFASLGAVVLLGQALPDHPHGFWEGFLQRLTIAVLVLFPYLLYRFSTAFRPAPRRLAIPIALLTVGLVGWTFALREIPEAGEPKSGWFIAYLATFLFHWTLLLLVVAWRLLRAGRGQPTLARRRMQLLAFAAAAITAALFFAAASDDKYSWQALTTAILAFASSVGFLFGLAPPRVVRMLWRRPEQERVQQTIWQLMRLATHPDVIAERALPPMVDLVGASAIALRDENGALLASYNVPDEAKAALERGELPAGVVELESSPGSVVVWTSPYAPFFGDEELRSLKTLSALTAVALDRARLFAQERDARLALESADQLKTNFVALAAHELRAPVGNVHAIAQTIVQRRGELAGDRRVQLENMLLQQTSRLGLLVEQLLDLSRLDAEAIPIEPRRFTVRPRIEELVASTAGDRADIVSIDVDPTLEACLDPPAFDRVVSNLVANALRYGDPPVFVHAEQRDRHFRLTVEDRGPGVAADFVPNLFDRFTRSSESSENVVGTGLGLAIARAYALAQHGDLFYEPAQPAGARFHLVLPTLASTSASPSL